MPAVWVITRHGALVETHETLAAAQRAFWVLTAHSLKVGGRADYELNARSSNGVCEPSACSPSLPDWALKVLAEYGL